jgi:Leucine-rich repeat (LRR) protein
MKEAEYETKKDLKKGGLIAAMVVAAIALLLLGLYLGKKLPQTEDVSVVCDSVYTDIKTAYTDALKNNKNVCALDISNGTLFQLTIGISQIKTLKVLSVNDNMVLELPDWIGSMIQLRELNIRNNRITSLPDSMSALQELEVLDLRGNPIPKEEIENIKKILPKTTVKF